MLSLKNKSLFKENSFIANRWVAAENGETMTVTNPSTQKAVGNVPMLTAGQVRQTIDSAFEAWFGWRSKTAKERSVILRKWFELMVENQEDLAAILTSEQGKPFDEAKGEIAYAASFIEWYAEEAKRIYGDTIPSHRNDARIVVTKEPVGVCAAITPWNFPAAMITRKAGPALAAGCTMIVKPAAQTPFSALALAELAYQAGLPPGVFNVVTGDASLIGEVLTANPKVRKLTFTGSTEVGKQLMVKSAETVKKISLELGGHAPFVVFDDADIDGAVAGAIMSKYRASGQTCVCANRFYIQDAVYDVFMNKLVRAVTLLKVADGFEPGAEQGPMIDARAVKKVESQIDDAVSKGAEILAGGKCHALGGTYFEPTVLGNVSSDMIIAKEETFGPVAPVFRFQTEPQAVTYANDTEYGLAAYLYTRDMGRIWRVCEALEYGMVGVNTGIISTESAPFGGMKQSGIGREGSKYGIDEFLEIKYLCIAGIIP